MVSIRLGDDEPGWERTALRCLKAGATLYDVPGERLGELTSLAREHDLKLTRTETPDGWRVTPSSSDPTPLAPSSEDDESAAGTDAARPGSDVHSPTDMTDLP